MFALTISIQHFPLLHHLLQHRPSSLLVPELGYFPKAKGGMSEEAQRKLKSGNKGGCKRTYILGVFKELESSSTRIQANNIS